MLKLLYNESDVPQMSQMYFYWMQMRTGMMDVFKDDGKLKEF